MLNSCLLTIFEETTASSVGVYMLSTWIHALNKQIFFIPLIWLDLSQWQIYRGNLLEHRLPWPPLIPKNSTKNIKTQPICLYQGVAPCLYGISAYKANTTLSLNSWEMGVGQASFLFHISQQFLPILEGRSVEKSKLRWGRFHFTFKSRWEMWNECNFRVITMRGRGISFHGPVNSAEVGGHRSKPEVVLA